MEFMRSFRLIAGVLVLLVCLPNQGFGQTEPESKPETNDWIGTKVMPLPGATLLLKGVKVRIRDINLPLVVTDVNEKTLITDSQGRRITIPRQQALSIDDALAKYDALLEKDPENPDLLALKATLFVHLKQHEQASAICERLLENDQSNLRARLIYAGNLYRDANYEAALKQYESVLEQEAKNPIALSSAAHCYVLNGEYARALANYDQAIEIESLGVYFTGRSQAHRFLGNPEKALRDARFGIKKMSPFQESRAVGHIILAHTYYYVNELRDYSKALANLEIANKIRPFDRAPYFELTISLCESLGEEEKKEKFEQLYKQFTQNSQSTD